MKAKIATFSIMLAFWILLSGKFDFFHLTLGLFSCLLVTAVSSRMWLFFPGGDGVPTVRLTLGMLRYLPWLLWQIIVANFQMTWIVLHPRMKDRIDPQLVRFSTRLKTPLAKVCLAQSITLTPGTITVSVFDDEFTVYALTRQAAESLPGEMETRVARALEED